MTSKVDAKEATSEPEVAQYPEPSYEACHKVLETIELLEMILLSLHGSQDMFKEASHPPCAPVSLDTQYDTPDRKTSSGKCRITYEYTQDEAYCNMTTLLLSQRVNHIFKDTIQGSFKLQRALWFTELKGSRDHSECKTSKCIPRINPLFSVRTISTAVHAETLCRPNPSRHSIAIEFRCRPDTERPESWSRMLIAQTSDQLSVRTEVAGPVFRFFNDTKFGPNSTTLCATGTAGEVLKDTSELDHEYNLDFMLAGLEEENLIREVQQLEAKGGYLYRVAKSNLEKVRRELKKGVH